MSGSHARRKSDFSIARILSDDPNASPGIKNGEEISNIDDYPFDREDDVDVITVEHQNEASLGDNVHEQRLRLVNSCGKDEKVNLSRVEDSNLDMCGELGVHSDLQWLQCTRYRPPRLPRRTSGTRNCKRRPATHPRIPFTSFQLEVLEDKYKTGPYLTRKDVLQLAGILRLPQSRVKIWFQNRRARDRRESKVSSSLSIS
ncbi:homeobox protein engrailed-2 [Diachasma alloeum]|uniref:homeobox protein engrailed-2 n=1 Tax=Diachasma alloeum TaxID=454923 RepID=UPI0007383C1B|nr:homeobox protein engrailed-2 [Diachasma alloeum]